MVREDELSAKPGVLLLLVTVLAGVTAVLAFEAIRAGHQPASPPPSNGSSAVPPGSDATFGISGDVGALAPGLTKEIAVTFTNPNAVPIYVPSWPSGSEAPAHRPGARAMPT